MIPPCRLIYPYFDNPRMLAMQVENWGRMRGELKQAARIIVVDDCSSKDPVPILKNCHAHVECYRMQKRIPWNMHQCRNLGAKMAAREGPETWLFMSDIDIMLTPEMAFNMLDRELDPGRMYTMERTFAPGFTERKTHPNTFLVQSAAFWQVNGYDLDLTPVGGGGYGGDNQFVKQLKAICPEVHLDDVVLIGYGRRTREGVPVIKDADTTSLDRAEWHLKYVEALNRKKAKGDMRSVNPIRTPYERVL